MRTLEAAETTQQLSAKMPYVGLSAEHESRLSALCRLHEAAERIRRMIPDLALEAISWMHLKHPIHPVQKELIQEAEGARFSEIFLGRLGLSLSVLLYAGYFTIRIFQLKLGNLRLLKLLRAQAFEGIVKSWRFHPDPAGGKHDFYFGNLGRRLREQGKRVLFLYGNPNGASWKGPRPRVSAKVPELPELALAPLSAPIRFAWGALKTSVRLKREVAHETDALYRRILMRASRDCLLPQHLPVALFEGIGQEAAAHWRPRFFASLYEGHAWEACLFRGVRLGHPECRTVGYQHTILLPHQLSLLAPQGEYTGRIKPDVVLCLGPHTSEMLSASHLKSDRIPFGTFRKLPSAAKAPEARKKTVLVLPEGHLDETQLLFQTALDTAKVLPDHRFVLRCHPVLPFDRVRLHLRMGSELPPNVEVSFGSSIGEDFARSSALLYRGSSSVLFAVLYGLKPFYFGPPGWDEVDPLFTLSSHRERTGTVTDLDLALRRFLREELHPDEQTWQEARAFVERYLIPVEERSIQAFLSAACKPGVSAS